MPIEAEPSHTEEPVSWLKVSPQSWLPVRLRASGPSNTENPAPRDEDPERGEQ